MGDFITIVFCFGLLAIVVATVKLHLIDSSKPLSIIFLFAVVFAVLGFFIDFAFSETARRWFLMVAVLSLSGFFIPRGRSLALFLLILALFEACDFYRLLVP